MYLMIVINRAYADLHALNAVLVHTCVRMYSV